MAENLELVRQAIDIIKNETEAGANTAARVGSAMSGILEYSDEQITAEKDTRSKSDTQLSTLIMNVSNRTTELEEDRNLMQKVISQNSEKITTNEENIASLDTQIADLIETPFKTTVEADSVDVNWPLATGGNKPVVSIPRWTGTGLNSYDGTPSLIDEYFVEDVKDYISNIVSTAPEQVNKLEEAVGDWDGTGNESIAEEIGSHYAEEEDENYNSGLWGQMRNTRSRVVKLESNVGSYATSEEDDGSVWGQLKWHDSEINGLHTTVANTIKSGGKINLASISATDLASIMSALGDNEIEMYLITDSSGNLPSLNNETAITISGTAKKLLFGKTDNFGVSVGDILAVTKLTCRIIPLNEAKAVNGDFPGADGLESVWDKGQINKISGIETTANNALPKVDRLPSKWNDNMNNALETGVYPWCTLGRPAGSTGAYTCIVNRTSTNDGSYDTIEQTAYGREGELGRIFKRIIFYKSDGTDTQYGEWQEITGSGVITVSSVEELPADAEDGSLAVVYSSLYYSELGESQVVYRCDAAVEDFPEWSELGLSGEDVGDVGIEMAYMSYTSADGNSYDAIFYEKNSATIDVIGQYTDGGYFGGNLYSYEEKNETWIQELLNDINALFEYAQASNAPVTLRISDSKYYNVIYKLLPKLRKIEGDKALAEIYIKGSDGWINPIETFKSELQNEISTNVLNIRDASGVNPNATITASGSGGIVLTHVDEDDLEWTAVINPANAESMLSGMGFYDSIIGLDWTGSLERSSLQSGIYLEDNKGVVLKGYNGVTIYGGGETPSILINDRTTTIDGQLKTSDINVQGLITTNGLQIDNPENLIIGYNTLEHLFLEYQVSLIPNSGVTFNKETGYWSCNGIEDITDEEMKSMIAVYNGFQAFPISKYNHNNNIIRTNIPNYSTLYTDFTINSIPRNLNHLVYFCYSNDYKVTSYEEAIAVVSYGKVMPPSTGNYDNNAPKLVGILNILSMKNVANTFTFTSPVLKKVFLDSVVKSIVLKSPVIHYDSLRFLIEQAANTSAIQVTVHATTYSYLTGEAEPTEEVGGTTEEWQALVTTATEKNITFATA